MKKMFFALLAVLLLLSGCRGGAEQAPATEPSSEPAAAQTVFPDGNPEDVTCKGSYTGAVTGEVVATAGTGTLTNDQLQVWYWAEIAQWHQENPEGGPDFEQPLEDQACPLDSTLHSWQQFFLKRALDRWHTAQALVTRSEEVPLPTEEAYQPNPEDHGIYLTDIPATRYLYGYDPYYSPNTLHQQYLDELPDAYGKLLNRAYMYFTQLSYSIEPTGEELTAWYEEHKAEFASQEPLVDIRHILLVPTDVEEESSWQDCEKEAKRLLSSWKNNARCSEGLFADLANKHSADTGTASDGGGYQNVQRGQLMQEIEDWCFDPARQAGDTAILRTEAGVHILYFSRSRTLGQKQAEDAYYEEKQREILEDARSSYPMAVAYSAITLGEALAVTAPGEVLYPDVAHERFPEVPLYLQQDYGDTLYGNYRLAISGCGISSLAMVASYLTDQEWTPPELCALFGRYSYVTGTDGMLFVNEPSGLGCYLREVCWSIQSAKEALETGHVIISLQTPGYWTGGGHYIVIESMDAEGMVQVRDSDMENYYDIEAHKQDRHTWKSIITTAAGFWIFEEKVTRIPACGRCGTGEGLAEDYLCRRCDPAVLRRETYLGGGVQ